MGHHARQDQFIMRLLSANIDADTGVGTARVKTAADHEGKHKAAKSNAGHKAIGIQMFCLLAEQEAFWA